MTRTTIEQLHRLADGRGGRIVLRPEEGDVDDDILDRKLDDELTPEEARIEHLGEPPDGTPWAGARERAAYDRVVRPFWPLLVARLVPLEGERYAGREAMAHFPEVLNELADRTAPEDQEAFLDAADLPFEEVVGPCVACCHCRHCGWARRWQRKERAVPREARLRAAFAHFLSWHLEYVLKAPNAYDRSLGMPACAWPGVAVESDVWEWPDDDAPAGRDDPRPARGDVPWSNDAQRRRYERITALAWPLLIDGLRPSPDGGYYWRHVERRLELVALHLACAVVPAADQTAFIDGFRPDPRFAPIDPPDPPCRCTGCRPLAPDDPGRLACPVHREDRFAGRLYSALYDAFYQQAAQDRDLGMPRRSGVYPWRASAGAD